MRREIVNRSFSSQRGNQSRRQWEDAYNAEARERESQAAYEDAAVRASVALSIAISDASWVIHESSHVPVERRVTAARLAAHNVGLAMKMNPRALEAAPELEHQMSIAIARLAILIGELTRPK